MRLRKTCVLGRQFYAMHRDYQPPLTRPTSSFFSNNNHRNQLLTFMSLNRLLPSKGRLTDLSPLIIQ